MLRAVKYFKEIKAVDDISFEVSRGEIFDLLGPNGAGKSTTINMLTGILKPDNGTVYINDNSDPTRPEIRNKIGNGRQTPSSAPFCLFYQPMIFLINFNQPFFICQQINRI